MIRLKRKRISRKIKKNPETEGMHPMLPVILGEKYLKLDEAFQEDEPFEGISFGDLPEEFQDKYREAGEHIQEGSKYKGPYTFVKYDPHFRRAKQLLREIGIQIEKMNGTYISPAEHWDKQLKTERLQNPRKRKTKNPPPRGSFPKELRDKWEEYYDRAFAEYRDEKRAAMTAWAIVKRSFKKDEKTGKWVKIKKPTKKKSVKKIAKKKTVKKLTKKKTAKKKTVKKIGKRK